MRVIGTAGHVDHGKSTLVQALTGVHPDRLKEEREREMTIDLGFAWLELPVNGQNEEVGIVDVPGHRDFIENMLAGVGGIDAVLFVVAADEGVMPQTREHLAILDMLRIPGGVAALTKIDMLDENGRDDWLDLVESDLRQAFSGTVLADAPIVRVSARTGEGLDALRAALTACLAERPARPDLGRPRLSVDRVFTIAGFGTVVTGTLLDGRLNVGDELEILPRRLRGRVRGLQTHKHKHQQAVPGSRTAVNITGVPLDDVRRGDLIAHPGDYQPTQRLDVQFHLLPDVSAALKHNTEVKFFIGAAETAARVRLLGSESLSPGADGWLQIETSDPIVAKRGDRYILRRPSPGETLGGGAVVDAQPLKRHKRFSSDTLQRLEALSQGDPLDVLLQAMPAVGAISYQQAIALSNLKPETAEAAAQALLAAGGLINLDRPAAGGPLAAAGRPAALGQAQTAAPGPAASPPAPEDLLISRAAWQSLSGRAIAGVEAYHRAFPLRRGMPREELKSRLKDLLRTSPRLFAAALRSWVAQGTLEEVGPLLRQPGHTIAFSPQQQSAIDDVLQRFIDAPAAPPSFKDVQTELGGEVANALLETGELILAAPDVVFRRQDYARMVQEVRALLEQHGTLTVAQARDHFNTSRKFILAFLEHLDAVGVTARQGNDRTLNPKKR